MNEIAEDNSIPYDKSHCDISEEFTKESTKIPQIQYQIQHGVFKWSIEKFSHFPSRKDKYFLSPVFVLKETWWNIALHPKAKICGLDKISFNLIRRSSDLGPKTVIASYRLGLENAGNKVWFKAEESKSFGKADCFGFETSLLGHLEDFLPGDAESNDDTISVLCEIYVKYASITDTASDCNGTIIDLSLPKILINLYRTQQYSDVLIEIPKAHFRVHKFVLCARSRTLSRILEDGKSFIQLSCTSSCLNCALLYMYSADFNFLAKYAVFSIGLYELACELSLDKLRDFLTPHEIVQKSRIIFDKCKFSCTLRDFHLANIIRERRESEVYIDRKTGLKIKFCFQKTNSSSKLVQCRMDLSGIAEALDFSFKVCLLNKNRKPFEIIPAILSKNSSPQFRNSVFSFTLTFSEADILTSLSDNNLCIFCVCERYLLNHLSNKIANAITGMQICFRDTNTWLKDLSSDLEEFYRSGKLSDLTVMTTGQQFNLHRAILAARSEYFQKIIVFDEFKNKITKSVDIDPSVFDLLCTYIYSGTLSDLQYLAKPELLELYETAENYGVKSLIDECERHLELNLDFDFVFDVMDVASKYNKVYLKYICLSYMHQHGLKVPFEESMK